MRIIVCGDRNWTNGHIIRKRLETFPARNTVIITGGCKGADKLAEEVAFVLGFQVWTFHANWRRGKKAGPERNATMLKVGKPDVVIAFHNDLSKSKGTADMCQKASDAGVPVELWGEKDKHLLTYKPGKDAG